MNIRRTMYKLQSALVQKGIRIKIDQRQVWSEKHQRMNTKYVLSTLVMVDGKLKTKTLLETYQPAEAVKVLADLYGRAQDGMD